MADRTDIDALLISALYGELTPADEARLTAHLESHPADRTALADLTQTRATVRESRILTVQHEPPSSVSAMLLREAARRAPRHERDDASWFQRFVRSFMAHPAMAAAAMLVLVVGIAGTLYVRNGNQYAAPTVAVERTQTVASQAPSATSAPETAAAPAGVAAEPAADPATERADRGAGSAAYDVRLSDDSKLKDTGFIAQGERDAKEQAIAPRSPAAEPKLSKKGGGGIEMRSRELAPKDLEESQAIGKLAIRGDDRADGAQKAKDARSGAGPSGGLVNTPAPAPSADLLTRDEAPVIAKSESTGAKKPAPAKSVARTITPPAQAPAPVAKPPAPASADADTTTTAQRRFSEKAAPAENKPADKAPEDKLLAWAKQQHGQVVALVNANNCRAAANAAITIYNRAPDYYTSNVATDRSIKPCLPYLTSEREREERSRTAAKRATATDVNGASPAPPPPPAAK